MKPQQQKGEQATAEILAATAMPALRYTSRRSHNLNASNASNASKSRICVEKLKKC
jgi:hypothetical protein